MLDPPGTAHCHAYGHPVHCLGRIGAWNWDLQELLRASQQERLRKRWVPSFMSLQSLRCLAQGFGEIFLCIWVHSLQPLSWRQYKVIITSYPHPKTKHSWLSVEGGISFLIPPGGMDTDRLLENIQGRDRVPILFTASPLCVYPRG